MKKISALLQEKLDPATKNRLRHVKHGLSHLKRALSGDDLNPTNQNSYVASFLSSLPRNITPVHIRQLTEAYSQIKSVDVQYLVQRELFTIFSFDAVYGRVLSTEYFKNVFADSLIFEIMLAGHERAAGFVDAAVARLTKLHDREKTHALALLVAQCLMRPPGREKELLEFLKAASAQYPENIPLKINLATTYFILGQRDQANAALSEVKERWKTELHAKDENYYSDIEALKVELKAALQEKTSHRHTHYDDSIYLEQEIQSHWEPYFTEMYGNPEPLYFGWLNSFYRDTLCNLIEESNGSLKQIINFGVLCAQPDYESAVKHPHVEFQGVDRQKTVQTLNEKAYPLSNLHFHAGEIEDVLPGFDTSNKESALFHARVTTLCYPEKVRQLYKQCADLGVQYIVVFENYSVSHAYYEFFDYEQFPAMTIPYKNHQFIHNYQAFLEEAGYEVVKKKVLHSPTINSDELIDLGSTHINIVARLKR